MKIFKTDPGYERHHAVMKQMKKWDMIILFAQYEEERVNQVEKFGQEIEVAQIEEDPEMRRIITVVSTFASPGRNAEIGQLQAIQETETV